MLSVDALSGGCVFRRFSTGISASPRRCQRRRVRSRTHSRRGRQLQRASADCDSRYLLRGGMVRVALRSAVPPAKTLRAALARHGRAGSGRAAGRGFSSAEADVRASDSRRAFLRRASGDHARGGDAWNNQRAAAPVLSAASTRQTGADARGSLPRAANSRALCARHERSIWFD